MKKGFTLIDLIVVIAVIAFVSGILYGFADLFAHKKMQKNAVNLGIAEYVMSDSKTGKTEFKWKTSGISNAPTPLIETVVTNENEIYSIKIYKSAKAK